MKNKVISTEYVEKNYISKDIIKKQQKEIELLKDIKKANCYKQITTEDYLKGAIEQLEELLGE